MLEKEILGSADHRENDEQHTDSKMVATPFCTLPQIRLNYIVIL